MILHFALIFKQEEEVWTAECKELGTAAFGDTFEEAKESIEEAIGLHLNTLEDVGECERFLAENNVPIYREIPEPETIEIPWNPDLFVTRKIHTIPELTH